MLSQPSPPLLSLPACNSFSLSNLLSWLALLTRSSTLSFPPNLLSSYLSAPSTFLPPAPPFLSTATLSSTSPLLLLHSTTLSLQPRLLLSAPLKSPLPLSLYFPLHTFLFSFHTSTPCSFPSASTPLLSSPSPLLLSQPHTLLPSFSFTPPPSLPTCAYLLHSTFSPTSLLPTSFLPLSHSFTSFPPGLPSFPQPPSPSLF